MYLKKAVIFCLGITLISALPAGKTSVEEVEIIPLEDQNVGVLAPFPGPFDGLFDSLAGVMTRMRQQMDYLLRRLPFSNHTVEDSPFFGIPDIDLSKANTTSVTKVIDGHKVVINETEYKQKGDNGGAFFKVRIIDVLPDSSEMTTEKNAESFTPKDIESVESSFENEIPKNREDLSNIETFDEPDFNDNIETLDEENWNDNRNHYKIVEETPLEPIDDNSIEPLHPAADLSRDTYVNKILAESGAPTNPDAEVFSNVGVYASGFPYTEERTHS